MSSRIPENVIAEVRERTDIVAIVGEYVQLKRSGANYMGLCPFHDEKTPSFYVSPQRKSYYCFGCHEKGDAISFLRKMEGKGFVEVIEELAERAGVELPRVDVSQRELDARRQRRDDRQNYLRVNDMAARFFEKQLEGPQAGEARRYLERRGVDEETRKRFRLGFAPSGWDGLVGWLTSNKVPMYVAARLGLVVARRKHESEPTQPAASSEGAGEAAGTVGSKGAGGGHLTARDVYDFFRDRIMFPIRGPGGEVLGFSGRILEGSTDPRKYVNSPESPVFRKADGLYGIFAAKTDLRKTGQTVVVEGNLDVIAMHQTGHRNTVAPLGTALTRGHVHQLRRWCQQVTVLFDGDEAGRKASVRAAELLLESGLDGRVAMLEDGLDPDSALKEVPESVDTAIAEARPAADFLLKRVLEGHSGGQIPDRARALGRMVPILARVKDPVERALYTEEAAGLLGLDVKLVRTEVHRVLGHGGRDSAVVSKPQRELDAVLACGVDLLALLVAQPHLAAAEGVAEIVDRLTSPDLRKLLLRVLDMQADSGRIDVAEVLGSVEDDLADLVASAIFEEKFLGSIDSHQALREILFGVKVAQINETLKDLDRQMRRASAKGDRQEVRRLALRKHELTFVREQVASERT
ncbi:MAG: DNA primase [Deltaproteobacteria bacterium]|nr:DNA primase [Deltaproteobacteria bacterium]